MPLIDTSQPTRELELARELMSETPLAKEKPLTELLQKHRLGLNETLSDLRDMLDNSDGSLKMRGIETALKLNHVLDGDDKGKVVPVFIINIKDTQAEGMRVNPILLPRELLAHGL